MHFKLTAAFALTATAYGGPSLAEERQFGCSPIGGVCVVGVPPEPFTCCLVDGATVECDLSGGYLLRVWGKFMFCHTAVPEKHIKKFSKKPFPQFCGNENLKKNSHQKIFPKTVPAILKAHQIIPKKPFPLCCGNGINLQKNSPQKIPKKPFPLRCANIPALAAPYTAAAAAVKTLSRATLVYPAITTAVKPSL
ncbi:hypothetical protein B0H13DRAFT_1904887 [Mycena leptocephala]|nr:hypothetical protein B0H13DRAFT_1904887 [Mycena leptocephala]